MSIPRARFNRRVSTVVAVAASAGMGVSSLHAANVSGGGTLDPIPATALPAGAVQEQIITKPYSYTVGGVGVSHAGGRIRLGDDLLLHGAGGHGPPGK